MKLTKPVLEEAKELSFDNRCLFALSCSYRIIDLYKVFDDIIENENLEPLVIDNTGFNILSDIWIKTYDAVFNKIIDKLILGEFAQKCDDLAPSDEDYGGFETSLAQFSASSLSYSIRYILEKDEKYLEWCSDSVIEEINILESEKNGLDEDELDEEFKKELEIQSHIIYLLQNNNFEEFRNYIDKRKLSY